MGPGLVRTLLRLTIGNRVSVAYLALVAFVIAKAMADPVASGDPASAWPWPPLVTFPAFLLVGALSRTAWGPAEMPNWFFVATVVVSALIQALALGALHQAVRIRHQRMTSSC